MARRTGFSKKIEAVHWTYGSWQVVNQGAGITAINVLPAQHLPETLLRTRGEWVAGFATVQAPGTGIAVAVGLIQVPEGTGSTALWSPITDGDAPWIWWDTMHLLYIEAVTDVIAVQEMMGGRRLVDSKAMRKFRNTELQFVVEQATITGYSATNINTVGSARFLSGS